MHVTPPIATLLDALNKQFLPGIDLSLKRMTELLAALGNPEKKLPPVIHVAGTNGKGSTLAFLRAIYEASGYRVHVYTSPHLVHFNERIVLGGALISDAYLEQVLLRVREAAIDIPVTFFEAITAAAFLAFSEHTADVLLLETGLGGRLDATNVVAKPIATIITPVDYDHMEFLGNTLGKIATEKAGIMKDGVPCFIGAQKPETREVLKRAARERRVPLTLHSRDWMVDVKDDHLAVMHGAKAWALPFPTLVGNHQYQNAALASVIAQALPQLPVTQQAMETGVKNARWPARLQPLTAGPIVEAWGARGPVFLDGGHNASAASALRDWMETQKQPVTLMFGMMQRKDAAAFLSPLVPYLAGLIAVPIPGHEAYDVETLTHIATELKINAVCAAKDLDDAAETLANCEHGPLLIAGSLFLAGEVLKNHS